MPKYGVKVVVTNLERPFSFDRIYEAEMLPAEGDWIVVSGEGSVKVISVDPDHDPPIYAESQR